jgi:transposase-like protein
VWHRSQMARGDSRDLRERLLQAWASGVSAAEIAHTTGVSPSSLRRWRAKQTAAGHVSLSTMGRALARAAWRAELAGVDAETVVFLDETSTQPVMTSRRGRAPRSHRVMGAIPRNHGPNITCLVALSPAGIQAPCVFAGAVTSALFVTWLLPTLTPGTTVVLDNLAVHRNAEVRSAIEGAGCHLR